MQSSETRLSAGIASIVEAYLRSTHTPGIALALFRPGAPLYTMAAGLADRAAKTPMTPTTLFAAGSVTKTITALVLLLLEGEGRLSLDDPLGDYFPGVEENVRWVDGAVGQTPTPILLRHLLAHTSGIPELGFVVSQLFRVCGVESQGPYAPNDTEGLFRGLLDAARLRYCRPGVKFLYCNENYVLLARIVEQVCGRPFAEVVRKRVFVPLGMADSGIGFDALLCDRPRIMGYVPAGADWQAVSPLIPASVYGAGGLVTNAADMGRYLAFLLGNGTLAGEDAGFYTQRLWQKTIPRDGAAGLFYGLGWYIQDGEFTGRLVYHGGDLLFSGGLCALLPENGLGIAIGQNAAGSPAVLALARRVLEFVLGGETSPAAPPSQAPATGLLSAAEISGCYQTAAGVYRLEAAFEGELLNLRLNLPGVAAPLELAFAAAGVSAGRAEFAPVGYPPAPRRSPCLFIRSQLEGRDGVWLQYDNYLFFKPGTPPVAEPVRV